MCHIGMIREDEGRDVYSEICSNRWKEQTAISDSGDVSYSDLKCCTCGYAHS